MTPEMDGLPLTILTYSDIHLDIARQKHGWGDAYQKLAAIVRLSPADMKKMGLADGGAISLRSEVSHIVVEARGEKTIEAGTGVMPASLYTGYLLADVEHMTAAGLSLIGVVAAVSTKAPTPLNEILPGADHE